ncbi:MAG: CpsD/CapB family tyrosine-protein kinase [Chloroherpetonaceae bacterium]|nr:CpsD/CapB family tyrosine-protein kinase [Chthonomonadaceae bacterium]MDW8207461.1 CpsD/CapB family tyrosine-protein kinase [Chloroherpetonaceae bacterium]
MADKTQIQRGGMLSRFRGNGSTNGHSRNGDGRILIPEEYARLHADIERASSPSRCFVVGVTSAVYGEGKTTVAMNLAGTIAQNSTQRVILVDCNLRNWDLQIRLNLPSCLGLVDVLEGGEDDLTNVIQKTELENFTILPAGRAAANPARLARSPRLTEVMESLRMTNDFMVVDMAPVLPVADTRVLARSMDGIVMVVRAGVTPREIVARAIDAVGNDRVLGVVLNGTETAMPKWLQRYFS